MKIETFPSPSPTEKNIEINKNCCLLFAWSANISKDSLLRSASTFLNNDYLKFDLNEGIGGIVVSLPVVTVSQPVCCMFSCLPC